MSILAVAQMASKTGDYETNLAKMDSFAAKAAGEGARLLLLPELCASGYRVDEDFPRLAQGLDGDVVKELVHIAKSRKLWLYTSIPESRGEGEKPYNTAVLVNGEGLVSHYRKVHLWGMETRYFAAGDAFVQADTPLGKAGLLVCFDLSFPEAARANTLRGAELLLYSMAFSPSSRLYAMHAFAQCRALENICPVAIANMVGMEKNSDFFGGSLIVAADGKVAAVCQGKEEGMVCAEASLPATLALRDSYPYFKARRPDLYLNA